MRFCQTIKIALGCSAARHCAIKTDKENETELTRVQILTMNSFRALSRTGIPVSAILPKSLLFKIQFKLGQPIKSLTQFEA